MKSTKKATKPTSPRRSQYAIFLAVVAIVFVGFLVIKTSQSSSNQLLPGRGVQLSTLDGTTTSLDAYAGKVIILDFWATWCPPCKKEIPGYISLYNRYKDKGLVIIGVTFESGSPTEIRQFAQQMGINYPLVLGNRDIMMAYGGITGYPTTYVIDRSGKIHQRYEGYRPDAVFEKDILMLL